MVAKFPSNVVAVITPAAISIPLELIVTAAPTIAELKVETPVTFKVVVVDPAP